MRIVAGVTQGQVLQRVKNQGAARITGSCDVSGPVTATLAKKGKPLPKWKDLPVGRAAGGAFAAQLKGIPVGGPYRLTLKAGGASVTVDELFVGDVWLMAGQSNMQGIGNLDRAPKPHDLVRALYMDGAWRRAEEPLHLLAASPDPVHSGTAPRSYAEARKLREAEGKGVSVGVLFGREMLARTKGVPQGLITTAHGGTSMAQWNPALRAEGGKSLYGSMYRLWSATAQPVSGVLWYQGESDCGETQSRVYTQKMKELIAAFRRDLKLPRLPFLVVQIGRFTNGTAEGGKWWEIIREQERRLPDLIPHVGLCATIDLPLDDGIHIGSDGFVELARRLARQADRIAFGNKKEQPEPVPVSAEFVRTPNNRAKSPDGIRVKFKHAAGGLRAAGLPTGFALVEMDGTPRYNHYRTTVAGDTALIHCDSNAIAKTAGILYGPGANPHCNIADGRGAAIPAFGPLYLTKGLKALTSFLPVAEASEIQPAVPGGIATLAFPARGSLPFHRLENTPSNGFMSEHPRWDGKPGWAAFHFDIACSEAMPLHLLFGYDGPFRMALDGHEVFKDLHGTNPAIADSKTLKLTLAAGAHPVCILMDLNGGKAWGFWFRACRTDIPARRVPLRNFAMPRLGV